MAVLPRREEEEGDQAVCPPPQGERAYELQLLEQGTCVDIGYNRSEESSTERVNRRDQMSNLMAYIRGV